ncbi:MAG: DUF4834 family protein [Bacteroidia bacterium]|nr:DUF4834 family protein [Bacteroidia bacterium]
MFIFSILKFILFVILFFVILGIVAVLFLRRAVKRASKNFSNQFNEQQPQDTTTFHNKTQSNSSSNYKDKGEYIDFEEIK